MGFGNFLRGVAAQVNPFDRGKTYGSYNPKKKRQEYENSPENGTSLSVSVARPNQNISVQGQNQLEPKKPTNIFEDLNKNLMPGKPNNTVPLFNNAVLPSSQPKPGQVVKPTINVTTQRPTQQVLVNNKPVEDTPEDMLNRGLDAGKSFEDIARENRFDLDKVREYANATRPNYGIGPIAKPKQSFWDKTRDFFDANTQADQYRRQQGNTQAMAAGEPDKVKPINLVNPGNVASRTPIVGQIVKMLNTAGTQIPQLANTADTVIQQKMWDDLNKQLVVAKKNGNSFEVNEINRKLDLLSKAMDQTKAEQEAAYSMYQKNKGGLFNAGTLYGEEQSREGKAADALKEIALPTAVTMLDLYTLGQGNIISEGVKGGIAKSGVKVGLQEGVKEVAPNIVKAGVGNFGSGAAGTYAEGGNTEQALQAGAINAVAGTVPDILLPAAGNSFKNRVLSKIFSGRKVNPADLVEELDDTAISASAEAANQSLKPRPIPVKYLEDIPVNQIEDLGQSINVRNLNQPGNLIQEVTGDATTATPNALIQKLAEDSRVQALRDAAFDEAKTAPRPNPAIEGMLPNTPNRPLTLTTEAIKSAQDDIIDQYAKILKDVGEGNGTQLVPDGEGGYIRTTNNFRPGETAGKKMSAAAWREEAERQLRSGAGQAELQKAFNDAADPEVQSLLAKGEPADIPAGRPIAVKQVNGIDVADGSKTVIPTELPETPGQVRVTTSAAPANAQAAAVAAQTPTALPSAASTAQSIAASPSNLTKRQVAAARNQRKLARALAKTQEQTAEAMDRIQTASPAAQSGEGFVPTGEFRKSVNGGAIQKVSRAAEMSKAVEETSQLSPGDVLQTARANQVETGGFNRRDIRNVAALFETKRLVRGTPEWNEARQILKEDGTIWGQTGALRNYTMRRTANADELMNRYESKIYRLAEDPSKIDGKLFDQIEEKYSVFTKARDDALAAYNRFTESPTAANAKLYHAAQDAADAADKAAKTTEYKVADKVLKGNKDIKQVRELQKMASDADLYQMDAVDASMLSGTGTFIRNFVNAGLGSSEEGLFGGIGSRIAKKITGEEIGGGVGRGTISGLREGAANLVDASKARAGFAGWNPLEHIKNWTTTGNELGDTLIDSQVKHNVLDHYSQLLKSQGYKGRELLDRASVMARQDPDNLSRTYLSAARTAAGLGGGITRNNKIETVVKNIISDTISMGKPNRFSENTAKLVTRMTIGFPTAIGRSTVEGVKRFTLGAPTFIKAFATKDPMERALLIKEGIKQAGTGAAVIPPLFYAMGASGMITGAYPKDDPEEKARWERDGISENSIKIGGDYYQLPGYLGTWAVPGLFYASLGRNGGDFKAAAADTAKIVPSILPTDSLSNLTDVINGRSDFKKYLAQAGAGAVRASTPAGALLNQIAKSFDPTKNDTTSGSTLENFISKVESGIPGVSNRVPNKEDDAGNVINNPGPVPLIFGASSTTQDKGVQESNRIEGKINDAAKGLKDIGALDDANLRDALDEDAKKIYDKVMNNKKVDQSDIKKLQESFVKGISTTGEDTAYLERGQYDSNLTALKLKKQLMEADKTVKPSDLKSMDLAIKRGQIYKDNTVPYDMIDAYKTIGVEEWRKMGIPPEDDDYDPEYYDPDMYQKLWELDQMMTKEGASYRKGALDKNKFFLKETKGRGGSGGGRRGDTFSSDFGTLKAGDFAPSVQQYSTLDQASGSVPVIRTVRPNIVHKIGSSG